MANSTTDERKFALYRSSTGQLSIELCSVLLLAGTVSPWSSAGRIGRCGSSFQQAVESPSPYITGLWLPCNKPNIRAVCIRPWRSNLWQQRS